MKITLIIKDIEVDDKYASNPEQEIADTLYGIVSLMAGEGKTLEEINNIEIIDYS